MKLKRSIFTGLTLMLSLALLIALGLFFAGRSGGTGLVMLTLGLILLLAATLILLIRHVFVPLNRMLKQFHALLQGAMPDIQERHGVGETALLSRRLAAHVKHLEEVIDYAHQLSRGDISREFDLKSEKDVLGSALFALHESLVQSNAEAERRRREDEQRNWSSVGLARFSEMLRDVEDDLEAMSGLFIKHLVAYLEVEVGAFFLTEKQEDETQILRMTGSYAFDREKHTQKSFAFGEGLVGRCAMEKEVIYISEVPENYIRIRSGLGEDLPAVLVLVPVLLDDEVLGVIEIATFTSLPGYKIAFLKALSDSMATTISKVKINVQTAQLLQQSRRQAEEMSSQEEEMRQNMEELQSIQEQSERREKKLQEEVQRLKQELRRKDSSTS